MFTTPPSRQVVQPLWVFTAFIALSVTAFGITVWILSDFNHEQQVVKKLIKHLPKSDLPDANALAGELTFQFRLTVLLCVNIFAFALAMGLLIQAYANSERSLQNVRILATDVLASIDQGVITTDQNGVIQSVNPHGRVLIETEADPKFGGRKRLTKSHQPLSSLCQAVLQNRTALPDIDYTVTEGEYSRVLRAGCSLLRDKSQRCLGTVLLVRDVTKKVLTEKQLRRMERFTGLGSLAAGLQHEIKNPLSALSLHIQLLEESLRAQHRDDPAVNESMAVLQEEIKRINQVLEGFRDYASFDALQITCIDAKELLARVVDLVKPQASAQNIELLTDLPSQPLNFAIDTVRLEQVLLNLLVNAFTASPAGSTVTLKLKQYEQSAQIEVTDSGCGVPESLREKIFEPYFTTRSSGTGMGLALCEKIVQQHGGSIDLQNRNPGSAFVVSLPLTTEPPILPNGLASSGEI